MYPLKFNPILKSTIWGGEKIIPFKHLATEQAQVGESCCQWYRRRQKPE